MEEEEEGDVVVDEVGLSVVPDSERRLRACLICALVKAGAAAAAETRRTGAA